MNSLGDSDLLAQVSPVGGLMPWESIGAEPVTRLHVAGPGGSGTRAGGRGEVTRGGGGWG